MTVTVNDRRIQYTATAGQTIFPYDFKIDANTEIRVLQTIYSTGVTNTLTLTTEYTVSGVGDAGGGNITLVTGAEVNDTITIVGNTPLSRVTDFNQAGDFLVSDLNNQLDKLTNILQENDTTINRAVKLKDEDTTSGLEIPTATDRASKFLAFDASGNAIASAGTTETPVSSFMATVLDDTTAAVARTTLDAEQKANSLTAITTLQDADQFIVADNSDSDNSKKITKANLKTALETIATTTTRGTAYLNKPITIANNATDANNDIDFSEGVMNFSDGSGQAIATALTKQLDASWVAGTNAGGLFSGSKAPNTTYHCFAIWNPITGIYDAGYDTSIIAANAPSGYTKYERLFSFRTDSSGNIPQGTYFRNGNGYIFKFKEYKNDKVIGTQPLVPTLQSLASLPTGIELLVGIGALVRYAGASANCYALFVDYDYSNTTPSASNCTIYCDTAGNNERPTQNRFVLVKTNTSAQIMTNTVGTTYHTGISTEYYQEQF